MLKLTLASLAALILCSLYAWQLEEHALAEQPGDKVREEASQGRPPLSSLIGDREANITGNVEFLLDFAIAGHPKCGTTSMMKWIAGHPEVQMYDHEIRSIKNGKPALFVEEMYKLPPGKQYKRGYKAPNDLRRLHSLYILGKYWPNAHLIVGLRHPILWFQSWHNFKTRNGKSLGPAEELVGMKLPAEVRFHNNLSQLGKTNFTDPSEAALLASNSQQLLSPSQEKFQASVFESTGIDPTRMATTPLPLKVFLYVDLQLGDHNETRQGIFRHNLQTYLGLKRPFSQPASDERVRRGHDDTSIQQIDICHDQYQQLRSELVELGTAASKWIRTYFLPHPDVIVSSPEHFEELLKSWANDPCNMTSVSD